MQPPTDQSRGGPAHLGPHPSCQFVQAPASPFQRRRQRHSAHRSIHHANTLLPHGNGVNRKR